MDAIDGNVEKKVSGRVLKSRNLKKYLPTFRKVNMSFELDKLSTDSWQTSAAITEKEGLTKRNH